MDYCFNREEPRAKERKEEILECFRLLEAGERRSESTIATRGLQKLKEILRDGKRTRKSPQVDQGLKNPPPPQNYESSAQNMNYAAAHPNIVAPGAMDWGQGTAGQTNLGGSYRYPWADFDYSSLDNINFDVDLDAGQFDVLFQNIEESKMMF